MKQLLFSVGLARKAGKVIVGTDMVFDAIRAIKINIVLYASHVSENTRKRISDCCAYYHIKLYRSPTTKIELGNAIGKSFAACIGITDPNLSELITNNL